MIFGSKAKEEFKVSSAISAKMESKIAECADIYAGRPYWVDEDEHIKTINFAKSVCSETARLATLGISIKFDNGARGSWLQGQIDKEYFQIRKWEEYSCAYGTIVLKPNGNGVDLFTPDKYMVTNQSDGEVTGIVFIDRENDTENKKYYTRLEYHRFQDDGLYAISNKCYVGSSENDMNKSIPIDQTPWVGMLEEALIKNVEQPLYGILKTPQANNIDINSALSLPIFSEAIEELKDLDIAYSRNSKEIFDSKRTVLLDSDRLLPTGGKISNTAAGFERQRDLLGLPDYVKTVYGDGDKPFYEEINPTLETEKRLTGINALLSQIGYKCGFSNGYFVFNEKTGMVTATQVESDDRRTIQTIKDVRDQLEKCLDELIYALNVFADLYNLAPLGTYEVTYDFGDITYNREEDRARWWGYVTQNKVPAWYYFVKFEGMTKEEAKALVEEAKPKEPQLFGGM